MPTEMTMRDHYAAAALTGLIASREWPIDSDEAAHYCYRVADAMLRERERTNHDAAPAARASVESVVPQPTTRGDRNRTDKAAIRPSEGTGDTPVTESATTAEPVAWAVILADGDRIYDIYAIEEEAKAIDGVVTGNHGVVPLYRHPQPTPADAEREALSFAYEMLCQRARELQAVHAMESSRRCVEASRALQGLFERMGGER